MRILFYMIPQEKENRQIDMRLYNTMTTNLSAMADQVITMNSFNTRSEKQMVENVLVTLVDQWKKNNQVDPAILFQSLPSLDVDLLIFMERTHYDQVWKKDQKKLMIALQIAAFEMDFGQPLYADRYYNEIPWQGESTSYIKAEQKALLQVSDALMDTFSKTAQLINGAHEEEVRAQQAAQSMQEKERLRQLKEANEGLGKLVKEAEKALQNQKQPQPVTAALSHDINALKEYLKIPLNRLTTEQEEARLKLAYSIEVYLEQLRAASPQAGAAPDSAATGAKSSGAEGLFSPFPNSRTQSATGTIEETPSFGAADSENSIQAQPIPDEQAVQKTAKPLPSVSTPSGDFLDRRWLLPDPSERATARNQAGVDPLFGAPTDQTQPASGAVITGQPLGSIPPARPGRAAVRSATPG